MVVTKVNFGHYSSWRDCCDDKLVDKNITVMTAFGWCMTYQKPCCCKLPRWLTATILPCYGTVRPGNFSKLDQSNDRNDGEITLVRGMSEPDSKLHLHDREVAEPGDFHSKVTVNVAGIPGCLKNMIMLRNRDKKLVSQDCMDHQA